LEIFTMKKTNLALLLLVAGTAGGVAIANDDHGKGHDTPAPAHHEPATEKPASTTQATPETRTVRRTKTKAKPAEAAPATPAAEPAAHNDAHNDSHGAKAEPADAHAAPATAHAPAKAVSAEEALTLLTEGNVRWMEGKSIAPSCDSSQREAQAGGQTPFVTVLTCADSRIPVERVFDRGVGEVFTIRVAGNVSGNSETGTIEYGLGHLHTKLLVVMGHTKCGAVKACVDGAHNGALHGKVRELVASIEPSVQRAKRNNPGISDGELLNASIKENVWQGVYGLLTTSTEIRDLVSKGEVKVVGALYDIQSGKVEFLGEHPWQQELLTAMNTQQKLPDQPATAHAAPGAHEQADAQSTDKGH
jgi:carbonic anhydrase